MKRDVDEKAAKQEEQHGFSIAIFCGIALLVFISIFSIVLIVGLRQSSVPKSVILRHPNGEMVVAGLTKQDLKQAMKMSKEWARSYVREALRGARRGDFSEARENIIESVYPIQELLASGRVIRIRNGTKCLILKTGRSMCKVRITEGFQEGQTCWVYRKCVVR